MIPKDRGELYDILPAAAVFIGFSGLDEPVGFTSGLFCSEGISILEVSVGLETIEFEGIEEESDFVLSGVAKGCLFIGWLEIVFTIL